VLAAALAAAAALTVAAVVVAAFAVADRAPVTATAAALTAVERAVRAGAPAAWDLADRGVAAEADRAVERARRCAGTGEASTVAVPTLPRAAGRAVRAVDAVPGRGSDPSARRRSWWSELIHLTSVD
jgi:hypothetical protein